MTILSMKPKYIIAFIALIAATFFLGTLFSGDKAQISSQEDQHETRTRKRSSERILNKDTPQDGGYVEVKTDSIELVSE